MEHLEAILSNRLQLGEALADQVNQNRADLERQLLDRDQDHSSKFVSYARLLHQIILLL